MYLSQITLGKSQAAQLKLSDAYAWHQKLWEAFPGNDGECRKFLFRVDDAGRDFCALLLSQLKPEPPPWGHWDLKKVADSFLDHRKYRFQLRANPTMRRNRDRRRLAIYDETRLHDWMHRKAEQHGFEIATNSLQVGAPLDQFFVKKGRRGKHVAVDFQGTLQVADRDTFRDAFHNGIGTAKAFGFGMLMLQPVNQETK